MVLYRIIINIDGRWRWRRTLRGTWLRWKQTDIFRIQFQFQFCSLSFVLSFSSYFAASHATPVVCIFIFQKRVLLAKLEFFGQFFIVYSVVFLPFNACFFSILWHNIAVILIHTSFFYIYFVFFFFFQSLSIIIGQYFSMGRTSLCIENCLLLLFGDS